MMVLAHVPVCQMHLNNKSRLVISYFHKMKIQLMKTISPEISPIKISFAPDFGNYMYSKLFIHAILVFGKINEKEIIYIMYYSIFKLKFQRNDIETSGYFNTFYLWRA